MKRDSFKFFLLFTALIVFAAPLRAKEPENLHTAKQAGIFYHDSGEYDVDREVVSQEAITFLASKIAENKALSEPQKLAVVFDIDEKSLSNCDILLSLDFAFVGSLLKPELEKAEDPAIDPTLKLYEFAKQNDVTVFFITGRSESLRAATEKNLKVAGYTEWVKLFMKPDDYDKKSVIPYKRGSRKSIEGEGYKIIVNIGDQWSDLAGGHSERVFKLPNPYYYIP
jgi:predicted secreted acid phosphatase